MNNFLPQINRRATFHFLFIASILFILAWFTVSPLVFSTSDASLRYIQIHALIAERWQTLAIRYPIEIDPTYRYTPYYYAYSLVDGRLYFNISPFYPIIASFLIAAIGKAGLAVSPLIGSLCTAWGVFKLARIARLPHPHLLMWGALFSTPLLFYSVQVWDHTLGTGLAVLGFAFALEGLQKQQKRLTVIGGIILGLSLGQRPELYLFVAAVGIAWILINRHNRQAIMALVAGGAVGVLPVWVLQQLWVGHPLGMATATHLLGYGRPAAYNAQSFAHPRSVIAGNFLFHIEARDAATFSAALFTIIGIGLLFFVLRVPRYRKNGLLWASTILIFLGVLLWGNVARQNMVTGLISTFPLFGMSVVYIEKNDHNSSTHRVYRLVALSCLLYLISMLSLWPTFGARVWGSRYLLTLYPLLLFLAFYHLHTHQHRLTASLQKTLQLSFVVLLVAGTLLQFLSIRFNYSVVQSMAAERDAVAATEVDVLLTNYPFWPSLMGPMENKQFFYVSSEADIEHLIPKLYEYDLRRLTIVLLASNQLQMPEQVDNIQVTETKPFFYRLEERGK